MGDRERRSKTKTSIFRSSVFDRNLAQKWGSFFKRDMAIEKNA